MDEPVETDGDAVVRVQERGHLHERRQQPFGRERVGGVDAHAVADQVPGRAEQGGLDVRAADVDGEGDRPGRAPPLPGRRGPRPPSSGGPARRGFVWLASARGRHAGLSPS